MSTSRHPSRGEAKRIPAEGPGGTQSDVRRTRQIAVMLTSAPAAEKPAAAGEAPTAAPPMPPVRPAPPRVIKTPTPADIIHSIGTQHGSPPLVLSAGDPAAAPATPPVPMAKAPARPSVQTPAAEVRNLTPAPPRIVTPARHPMHDAPLLDPITSTGLQRAITGVLGLDEEYVRSPADAEGLGQGPDPACSGPRAPVHPTIEVSPKLFAKPRHGRYCRKVGARAYATFEALAIMPGRSVVIGPFPDQGGDETMRTLWDEVRLYFAGTGIRGTDGYYAPFAERAVFILDEGERDPDLVASIPPDHFCLHDDAKSMQEQTVDLLNALRSGRVVEKSVIRKLGGFGACLSHHDHFQTFASHHAFIISRLLGVVERQQRPYLLRADLPAAAFRAIPPPKRVGLVHEMLDEIAACVSGGPDAVDALPHLKGIEAGSSPMRLP